MSYQSSESGVTNALVTIDDLVLPNNDLDQFKKFFGLMREDEKRLVTARRTIEGPLEELVESFFAELISVPAAKSFFAEPGRADAYKRSTAKYLQQITGGSYEDTFINGRLQTGLIDEQFGVDTHWWLGLYSHLLDDIYKELYEIHGQGSERIAIEFLSFTKILIFDAALNICAHELKLARLNTPGRGVSVKVDGRQEVQNVKIAELMQVLSDASGRVSMVASQLSSSTAQALSTVSETTATAEEVRQVAEQTSSKAKSVSDDAKSVVQVSRQGQEATDATIQGMVRIREQMDSIAECMVQLSNQSKLIGEIIATVDDLAQQSNLLAVNASIEAAKAGDQGKGFAVVAQEVKNLSQQSKTATAHVRNILNDILKATSDATAATEQGGKAVEAGHLQATNAGQVIRRLTDSIEKASEATDIIEVASQQQLVGMKQMVDAMEGIKQASEQNASIAEQLENSSKEIINLGQNFLNLVNDSK